MDVVARFLINIIEVKHVITQALVSSEANLANKA